MTKKRSKLTHVPKCKLFGLWNTPLGLLYQMKYGFFRALQNTPNVRIVRQTAFNACLRCPVNGLTAYEYKKHYEAWEKRRRLEKRAIRIHVRLEKGRPLKNYLKEEERLKKKYSVYNEIIYCPLFRLYGIKQYKLIDAIVGLQLNVTGSIRELCEHRQCTLCWNRTEIPDAAMYNGISNQYKRLRILVRNYEDQRHSRKREGSVRGKGSTDLSQTGSDI